MINYAYQSLFYKDNIEKQLNISFTGGSITNTNIRAEEFELEEDLCAGNEIVFGECNANKVTFVVGYYEKSIANKNITITITPSGGTAFQLGIFKVLSDYPTADKKFRKIIAYDVLYEILKADVRAWYDTILPPGGNTTITLKQFRDSFFTHFGVTQETVTLPNDSMTVTRTINPSCITGKTVLKCILELNACFGKIGRDGKFKYVSLEKPTSGLFPATTLYPSTTLYPQKRGFAREENQRVYNKLSYQKYETKVIDCLMVLDERGDVKSTIGNTTTNVYLVKDNFLVFGKTQQEVNSIATNMFANITDRFYRPCEIDTIGNPCLEVGDGINVTSIDEVLVNTYILRRKLKGIQSLKDNYKADGLEYRANDRNSPSEQLGIVKDNVRKIEADYVKTTYLEANYITAGEIAANYVTATYVETNFLKTSQISTISLDASQITTGTLDAARINASSISVNKLDVNTLMANTILNSTDNDTTSIRVHDLYFRGYGLYLQPVTIGGNGYFMLGFPN